MIHLFHGENTEASRQELSQLREKYMNKEVVVLDGRTLSVTDLVQATESASLFQTERLVIIENLFSQQLSKKNTDSKPFLNILSLLPKNIEAVFWEAKELPKTTISLFPKTTDIALFKPHRVIFSFVESLIPGNTREMLSHFEASLKNDAPELIFVMLVRQIRYLLLIKDMGLKVTGLSPWQKSKFMRQAEKFTVSDLLSLYQKLLDIDVTIKTGISPFSLSRELRLFLLKL